MHVLGKEKKMRYEIVPCLEGCVSCWSDGEAPHQNTLKIIYAVTGKKISQTSAVVEMFVRSTRFTRATKSGRWDDSTRDEQLAEMEIWGLYHRICAEELDQSPIPFFSSFLQPRLFEAAYTVVRYLRISLSSFHSFRVLIFPFSGIQLGISLGERATKLWWI